MMVVKHRNQLLLLLIFLLSVAIQLTSALDYLFNGFGPNDVNITLTNDTHVEPPVICLTNNSKQFPIGRAFYSSRIPFKSSSTSFSTQFVFSILSDPASSPGFGLAFFFSNTTSPPEGKYFGLFSPVAPILAVEFDVSRDETSKDPDDNHVGIDLNSAVSATAQPAGYYNSTGTGDSTFVSLDMRNGQNIHAWIELNGPRTEINVTIAPAGIARPAKAMLSYRDPLIANFFGPDMLVGFSSSRSKWAEAQRVLAWSFSDVRLARDINTTGLPTFRLGDSGSSRLSKGLITGVSLGCLLVIIIFSFSIYRCCWKKRDGVEKEDGVEVYWPHRYSYEELQTATKGFSNNELLGSGGFGKVYKAALPNTSEVAVKCVNHNSEQGLREFMAEISSGGRLQHKNVVPMRGWCRRGNELLLVYDFMPNGSLNQWIFKNPKSVLSWAARKRVLSDVAEGLNYLHHGWDQVVLHRDIMSSNVLLDSDKRGRLGDFGLAKLYTHGGAPNTTRVVGTIGYLAPEVVTLASPTAASDVYSFGVVVLEVACGRRPLESMVLEREKEEVLIEWVRHKCVEGRLVDVADTRIKGEYEVEEMEAVLKLGLSCCRPDPARRPTMREVMAMLLGELVEEKVEEMLSDLTPSGSNVEDEKEDSAFL